MSHIFFFFWDGTLSFDQKRHFFKASLTHFSKMDENIGIIFYGLYQNKFFLIISVHNLTSA